MDNILKKLNNLYQKSDGRFGRLFNDGVLGHAARDIGRC